MTRESSVSDPHADAHPLLRNFEVIASAPDGVQRLREAILQLAVRGRLVAQDPSEQPASVLLERINVEKQRLYQAGEIRKPKNLPPIETEQAPFKVPDTWEWTRLGEVGAIVGGGTPRTKVSEFWADEGIPWLTPADLRDLSGKYIDRGRRDISVEGLEGSSAQLLPAGSVLFSSRAPIGYVAIAGQDLATNQGFKSCLPYLPDLNQYLYWFLVGAAPEIDRQAPGTTFREVSGKIVSRIPLPLPPLREQRRISEKIDRLMTLCDELEKRQNRRSQKRTRLNKAALHRLSSATTDAELTDHWSRVRDNFDLLYDVPETVPSLHQAILQLAVRGKLVPQDLSDEPASVLLERIQAEKKRLYEEGEIRKPKSFPPVDRDERPFELPEGWEWTRLGSLAFKITDGAHKTPTYIEEGVPFVSVKDFSSGWLDLSDTRFIPPDEHEALTRRCDPRRGDILLARIGTLGCPVIVDTDREFSLFVSVGLIRFSHSEVHPEFLRLVLASPHGSSEFDRIKAGGSHTNKLNLRDLRTVMIPLPPFAEQERIVRKVGQLTSSVDGLQRALSASRETARRLTGSLVHRVGAG